MNPMPFSLFRFVVMGVSLFLFGAPLACEGETQKAKNDFGDSDGEQVDSDEIEREESEGVESGEKTETDRESAAITVVTFNTGTTESMAHDSEPNDGYSSEHAARSDAYYGDGLAWKPAVEAAKAFLAEVQPDVVVFQEIFWTGECVDIPEEAKADFICEDFEPGGKTVAQIILGEGYQVACHPGKPDKCAAVRSAFGAFEGCEEDFCLEGLEGFGVEGCGRGARIARGVIQRSNGETLTLVSVHGSSGISGDDKACRLKQFEQIFVDMGNGLAAANGEKNLIMGDFNTDPGRLANGDESAAKLLEYVGEGKRFQFLTRIGTDAPATYGGLFNIDHVISDALFGECKAAGVDEGLQAVSDALYFDHTPIVCKTSFAE